MSRKSLICSLHYADRATDICMEKAEEGGNGITEGGLFRRFSMWISGVVFIVIC